MWSNSLVFWSIKTLVDRHATKDLKNDAFDEDVKKLGKKNNAYIYNFLPDIISNLSGEKGLQEDRFQEMIKFLFELLEKTRNTESLVTKLCSRFHNTK